MNWQIGGGHLKFQTTEAETASSQPDSILSYTARTQFKSPKTNKALIFLVRKWMFLFYHYVHNVRWDTKDLKWGGPESSVEKEGFFTRAPSVPAPPQPCPLCE